MNFNNPLMRMLAAVVAVAAGIRLSWELLRPALVPVSLIALLLLFLYVLLRSR